MERDFEIFMFVDALGWDLISREHFMEEEFPQRRAIEMQFGYSCSAIPTILSGATPAEHGHLSLFRFAPEQSPFKALRRLEVLLKPASFWNRGRIRHWLSKFVKKFYGFTGYFQLYQMPFSKLGLMDYCEKKDLFVPGGLSPVQNLSDCLEGAGLPYHVSNWRLGDRRNLEEGAKAIQSGKKFIFIYTAELDSILHDNVNNPPPVLEKLAWYKSEISRLLQLCRERGGKWRFTIFSDHGMTALTETVNLKAAVEQTGLVFGKDYGACYDSTLFRVHYLTQEAKGIIEKALEPFGEKGHWLTEDEEKHYGVYRADRSFGDRIFLTNPGIQIVPSDMGNKPLKGMHGFTPEHRDSLAAVLSTEPIPENIRRVADYFTMMKDCM